MAFYPKLEETIIKAESLTIPPDRLETLRPLIEYLQKKKSEKVTAHLNFICTHNSRRSQFSQIWAEVAAVKYGIDAKTYSGGVEVTACNQRTVASLKRLGFQMGAFGRENPTYKIKYAGGDEMIKAYSKLFDDPANPVDGFAAIMTCDHADENCPFIPGAEIRIPVLYVDPKAFDNTSEESSKYDERSLQIASEMLYVMRSV
ncbi:protein-tyrosine-phosphatase [Algoriphagus sediminis]|uniref:Protein-tyrosine-phosphatase n=1 Tax=Algoriphagus sediminis TaxID=3057113 RepID=A0ABT7Y9V9_9BACT|nr:protein-tyrosine-phosphatase [Algoriphagus sediminis]MDN3202994.1 protein-tyrosine-phosphatase [Algoriphagus sediminis]